MLFAELKSRQINVESELLIPIKYKDLNIESDLRCDFLVEKSLIVELKTVEQILPVHEAQILTYMKLLDVPKGLLINFNSTNIYLKGQKTYVNELYRKLPE
ncbi:MAG: GxxExxY protein [Bacteroidota bacterium]